MKLIIVTLFASVAFLFTMPQSYSQTPLDMSVWGGYSWLNGVAGAELQIDNWGISGGWFPAKMPGSDDRISSFSGTISFYGKDNKFLNTHSGALGACYYGSIGIASAGYRSQKSYNGGAWTDSYVEPMTIAMLGVKSYVARWQFKIGFGYGWSDASSSWTWETGFHYAIFSNHSW